MTTESQPDRDVRRLLGDFAAQECRHCPVSVNWARAAVTNTSLKSNALEAGDFKSHDNDLRASGLAVAGRSQAIGGGSAIGGDRTAPVRKSCHLRSRAERSNGNENLFGGSGRLSTAGAVPNCRG